jgi:hypothetical protein
MYYSTVKSWETGHEYNYEAGGCISEDERAVPPCFCDTYGSTVRPFPPHLTVADAMTRDVVPVQTDTPVSEIVSLLSDRALRAGRKAVCSVLVNDARGSQGQGKPPPGGP